MHEIDPALVEQAAEPLGTRDGTFMRRCLTGGLDKYRQRLAAIGFVGLDRVLDAGCGFGQWSLTLAETCGEVEAFDICPQRIRAATLVGRDMPHVRFQTASLEQLPYDDASFDGVFCYSTIYYTDVRRSLDEICRVLRPGGAVYLCSNGWGWYWHNFLRQPYKSADFDPRAYALKTFYATVGYRLWGRPPRAGQSVVTSRGWLARLLRERGVDVAACGGEGTINIGEGAMPQSFFRDRYFAMEGVSEWLGRKRGGAAERWTRRATMTSAA